MLNSLINAIKIFGTSAIFAGYTLLGEKEYGLVPWGHAVGGRGYDVDGPLLLTPPVLAIASHLSVDHLYYFCTIDRKATAGLLADGATRWP